MTVLWGTRIGAKDWQEEVITEDASKIEAAKAWAIANGFDRFRTSEFQDGDRPEFGANLLAGSRPARKRRPRAK